MRTERSPKIAVVIGGIGVRAAAFIPLFELLDEAQIEPDLVIGSSGGAFIAAMHGAGYSSEAMCGIINGIEGTKIYSKVDYHTLIGFAHPKLAPPGIGSAMKKSRLQQELYQRVFGDRRLEEIRPTTLLQSTDCLIGEGVLLDSGPLAEAVYAASAFAPDFPPIKFDGRWLCDGSYISPVPIMEAVKREADVVIAMFYQEEPKPVPSDLLESNFNILAAFFSRLVKDQTMMSIEMHHHEIILMPIRFGEYIGPWDTSAYSKIIEAGRKTVSQKKEEILEVIAGAGGNDRR